MSLYPSCRLRQTLKLTLTQTILNTCILFVVGSLCWQILLVSAWVVKMKDRYKFNTVICPLADVDCREDSGEVLKGTVIPNLSENIDKVKHGSFKFQFNIEKKEWECLVVVDDDDCDNDETIKLNARSSENLAFLCMVLGKK